MHSSSGAPLRRVTVGRSRHVTSSNPPPIATPPPAKAARVWRPGVQTRSMARAHIDEIPFLKRRQELAAVKNASPPYTMPRVRKRPREERDAIVLPSGNQGRESNITSTPVTPATPVPVTVTTTPHPAPVPPLTTTAAAATATTTTTTSYPLVSSVVSLPDPSSQTDEIVPIVLPPTKKVRRTATSPTAQQPPALPEQPPALPVAAPPPLDKVSSNSNISTHTPKESHPPVCDVVSVTPVTPVTPVAPVGETRPPVMGAALGGAELKKYLQCEMNREHRVVLETDELDDTTDAAEASSSSGALGPRKPSYVEIPGFTQTTREAVKEVFRMPKSFIRRQELRSDEWDVMVEYLMDEDDLTYLEGVQGREGSRSGASVQWFRHAMDRFEKEYYYLMEEAHKLPQGTEGVHLEQRCLGCVTNSYKEAADTPRDLLRLLPDYHRHWIARRAQIRDAAVHAVADLMSRAHASHDQPHLFPIAALARNPAVVVNYYVMNGNARPLYSVAPHVFLIPRLQEEYRLSHRSNVMQNGRRMSRVQLDELAAYRVLKIVRQHFETARLIMDRALAREKVKRRCVQLSAEVFDEEVRLARENG